MKKNVISIFGIVLGTVIGTSIIIKMENKKIDAIQMLSNKHLKLFLMMRQWVKVKQEGKKISDYLKREGYNNIAIYGMSYTAGTLLDELKNTDINVIYGIDKNADSIYSDINIVSSMDELAKVDVIVVTAVTFFDEIKAELLEKVNYPIISLEDILYKV